MNFTLSALQKLTHRSYRQLLRYIEAGQLEATKEVSGEYSIPAEAADRLLRDLKELDGAFATIANASGGKYSPAFLRYVFDLAEETIAARFAGKTKHRQAVVHSARVSVLMYWLEEHPYHPEALKKIETWLTAVADDAIQIMAEDLTILQCLQKRKE